MLVRVIRPFWLRGQRQESGATLELPSQVGRELVATGKAEPAEDAPPARGPMIAGGVEAESRKDEPAEAAPPAPESPTEISGRRGPGRPRKGENDARK